MTPSQREGHRRDSNGSSQSKWNCRDSSPITEPWVQFRHDLVLASSWSNQIQSPLPKKQHLSAGSIQSAVHVNSWESYSPEFC